MRSPDSLIPYARNPRTHSDEQISAIARSIEAFGFTNPILLDGNNGIIAGHGRLRAALALKLPEVPCIDLTGLSEEARRAYVIADNQLALAAGWDDGLLRSELTDIALSGFDMALVGFPLGELRSLMGDASIGAMPDLPDGDHSGFQQMTFMLTSEQAETVKRAIDSSHSMREAVDAEPENPNRNGNALALICELFITEIEPSHARAGNSETNPH